jgi:hypothetical protein
MDNEDVIKEQKLLLRKKLALCESEDAKGHGVFLFTHDDESYMSIMTFNTGYQDFVGMLEHAAKMLAHYKEYEAEITKDAPPREMFN